MKFYSDMSQTLEPFSRRPSPARRQIAESRMIDRALRRVGLRAVATMTDGVVNTIDVGAANPEVDIHTPIGALLAGHILQNGEVVLLITKPSRWFILLNVLRFIAIALILGMGSLFIDERIPGRRGLGLELAGVVIAVRLAVSVLQWIGKLYILTDLRVLRLSGVFNLEINSCPLRRVVRTRVLRNTRERLLRLGTIEITPQEDVGLGFQWQMLARHDLIYEQVVAAINRAQHNGGGRNG